MATQRICPECDARSDATICPRCGCRTIAERRPDDQADPLVGKVLDQRYRIEAVIGRGGMGSVYRGIQLSTKQVVAVKVIKPEYSEDTEAVKRFHREAKTASQLTHPHTIRVFDFGQSEEGHLYMVLEYLNGRTLSRARKTEGKFSERRIAGIASEVCQSLMEAHGRGLVHRDLKPDNIMLLDVPGHPNFVKVLDFGIAKFLSGSSTESNLTRAGAVVGTPQYMAPEQALGSYTTTSAVDIYALGVVIYEALTGIKPFDGDSAVGILMAHARNPIPDLPADCPVSPEMRALLRRMLAKDPRARPTAAELASAFERIKVMAPDVGVWLPQAPVPEVEHEQETILVDVSSAPPATKGPAVTDDYSLDSGKTRVLTLEPGAEAEVEARPQGATRWPLVVAGLVSLAALSGFLFWLGTRQEDGVSATEQVATVQTPAAAVEEPPAAKAAAKETAAVEAPSSKATPASFTVRFESVPPGAQVYDGPRELGKTPFDAVMAGPEGSRTFVFRLPNFRDAEVKAEVKAGAVVSARLERTGQPQAKVGRTKLIQLTPKPAQPQPAPQAAPKPQDAPKPPPKRFRPLGE